MCSIKQEKLDYNKLEQSKHTEDQYNNHFRFLNKLEIKRIQVIGERLETKQLWRFLNVINLNNVKTMLLPKEVRGR